MQTYEEYRYDATFWTSFLDKIGFASAISSELDCIRLALFLPLLLKFFLSSIQNCCKRVRYFLEQRDDPVAQFDCPLHDEIDHDAEDDDEYRRPRGFPIDFMDNCFVIVDVTRDEPEVSDVAAVEDIDDVTNEERYRSE